MGIFPFTVLQIGNGSITSTINGNLQYSQDLPQELPCILKFRGEYKYVHKIKVLLPTPADHEPPSKKRKTSNQGIDEEPTDFSVIPMLPLGIVL